MGDIYKVVKREPGKTTLMINGELYILPTPNSYKDKLVAQHKGREFTIFLSGTVHDQDHHVASGFMNELRQPRGDREIEERPILRPPDIGHSGLGRDSDVEADRAIEMRRRSMLTNNRWANIQESYARRIGVDLERYRASRRKVEDEILASPAGADGVGKLGRMTAGRSGSWKRMNDWSEELGSIGGRDIAEARGHHFLIGGRNERFNDQTLKRRVIERLRKRPIADKDLAGALKFKNRGPGTIDLVTIGPDGTIHLWETKGGNPGNVESNLGEAWVPRVRNPRNVKSHPEDWMWVKQTSPRYSQYMMQIDDEFNKRLEKYDPHLAWQVRQGTAKIQSHVVKLDTNKKLQHYQVDLGEKSGWLFPEAPTPPPSGRRRRYRGIAGRAVMIAGLAMMPLFGGALTGHGPPTANAAVVQVESGLSDAWKEHAKDATAAGVASQKLTDAARDSAGAHKQSLDEFRSTASVSGTLTAQLIKSAAVQKIAAIAIKAWAIVQQVLNMLMRANPFGAIVTAITVAIGGIILIVENWDTIKVWIDWAWQTVFVPIGKWITETWNDTIVPMFRSSVDAIGTFFGSIGTSITGLWSGIVEQVADWIDSIPLIGNSLASRIREFASPARRADGGMLHGSGTRPDDKVPVLASNGEFIVNAASTAQNLPLLEAINTGAAPAFADGGLISDTVWGQFSGRLGMTGPPAGADSADTEPGSTQGRTARSGYSARSAVSEQKTSASSESNSAADTAVQQIGMPIQARSLLDAALGQTATVRLHDEANGTSGSISTTPAESSSPQLGGIDWNTRSASPPEVFLASGGFVADRGGSTGGFTDANLSLLQAIGKDASVLSNTQGQQSGPAKALTTGRSRRGRSNIDRSFAIQISAPNVDAEFLKDKTKSTQSALTYSGRWA